MAAGKKKKSKSNEENMSSLFKFDAPSYFFDLSSQSSAPCPPFPGEDELLDWFENGGRKVDSAENRRLSPSVNRAAEASARSPRLGRDCKENHRSRGCTTRDLKKILAEHNSRTRELALKGRTRGERRAVPKGSNPKVRLNKTKLSAILEKHNQQFKGKKYEPPRHSVKAIRRWEEAHGLKYFDLSHAEREKANREVQEGGNTAYK